MKSPAPRLIIGLMSGTSVDAIDAALVRITTTSDKKYHVKVLHHIEHKWPPKLRQRILNIMSPANTTIQEVCELNTLIAHEMAAAVEKLLTAAALEKADVTAVACHGQTVCHLPPKKLQSKNPKTIASTGSTLQLGDISVMATILKMPVVGNFRPADMAVGGQGAPLVPWTDDALLSDATKIRCVQNIGGIANVTYLPTLEKFPETWTFYTPGGRSTKILQIRKPVLAFDTGPGNMILDALISLSTHGKKRYDKNGNLAAKGQLLLPLFRQLQAHPYFSRKPPKSTGREDFGQTFTRQLLMNNEKSEMKNLIHTLTRLTAWSIADAYLHFLPTLPDEVILCGGGADNPTLTKMLAEELQLLTSEFVHPKKITLRRIDDFGIPNKAKEAASFALLGAATLDGIPANLPTATGASRPVILGVIAKP